MSFIASIDQGTSSTRVILYTSDTLNPVKTVQKNYELNSPNPGWVDLDPKMILETTLTCLREVCECMSEEDDNWNVKESLLGVGITNQRETTILWDKVTGEPLYNALVWLDTRTGPVVKDIIAQNGGDVDCFRDRTGVPVSTYFSAVKILWLMQNVEEVRLAIEEDRCLFGTVDTWLIWNLTGEHVTDVTNASRTMLMNLETCEWDESVIE
eukprot:TRINITY_DN4531_c0_g1_i2.p2 TRINITY_DN4531_c0_g1~~TRINITY_DN4531_c0_g1_i2.p2  ORF type:complete len:211 (-),score=51.27 TRINITY_DN4531_c0_g1_i2:923-1555(-)